MTLPSFIGMPSFASYWFLLWLHVLVYNSISLLSCSFCFFSIVDFSFVVAEAYKNNLFIKTIYFGIIAH